VRVVRRDRALKRSLETQLLQSSRLVSLGEMTAGVAHELGQPLNAVSTAAEDIYLRLSEGTGISKAELKPIMLDVLGMVDRMSDTIDHLRVFSRDKQDEPRIAFDANEVVHSSLNILGTQLKSHGVQTDLNLAEGLPRVNGHSHQIEQVLLNLLGNARDALDERKGEAEKRVRIQTHQENGQVVLEVEDNGIGMDEEARARVFEPFFTTKGAERGTGLGLSISYSIVKNHNGQMVCESRKGEGTTFRVSLPVAG
jgi:histidine kinase